MKKIPEPPKENKVKKYFLEFFKKRLQTFKGLVFIGSVAATTTAGVSIYQEYRYPQAHTFTHNYLTKNSKAILNSLEFLIENPVQIVVNTVYIGPSLVKYHLGIDQSIDDKLREAVKHPRTSKNVEGLFKKDDRIYYAEIGGLMCLAQDENNKYFLRFYDIPSKNEEKFLSLEREQHNPEKILNYLKKDPMHQQFHYHAYLNKLIEKAEKTKNQETKEKLTKKMIQHFAWWSDDLYFPSQKIVIDYIYQNFWNLEGKLIGSFHTHNMSWPPSKQDHKASKYAREFVLVRWNFGAKYELFDLYKGKTIGSYKINK